MNENKFLIVGLGNIGTEYEGTRHNAGFIVLDRLAAEAGATYERQRYGDVAHVRVKNKELVLVKPSTYMNLSGNAVRYYLAEERIATDHLLIVVDELALPLGTLRLKGKGSAGGHNGLKHISAVLNTEQYARLRVGIGDDFARGQQVEYVLERFSAEERKVIDATAIEAAEVIRSFCLAGLERTMNSFNKHRKHGGE